MNDPSNSERPFTLEQYRALKVDKDEAQMDAVMARAEETRAWGEVARLEEQLAGAVDAYLSELVAESRGICEREGVKNLAEWIGKSVLARVTGEGQS